METPLTEQRIRVLTADMQGAWREIEPIGATGNLPEDNQEIRAGTASFGSFMRDFLLSENVIILAGLGASMGVRDKGGSRVCPTMRELWHAVREDDTALFAQVIERVRFNAISAQENIEALLSQCQVSEEFQADTAVSNFIVRAESIIVGRCRFPLADEPLEVHETFLRRIVRRGARQPRLRLFTTNYDLCFEKAAANAQFVVIDGFSHALPQVFDGSHFGYDLVSRENNVEAPDYIPNVFHLSKLHGSIDWEEVGGQVRRIESPQRPLIVYPRRSKFESSFAHPFIELMARFQMALRQPNTALLIVGFGFNDEHISQPIESAVRSNVGLKVVVVGPHLDEKRDGPVEFLRSLIQRGDRRLALCRASFEDFLPFIPDLVSLTEEERHRERLREVGR